MHSIKKMKKVGWLFFGFFLLALMRGKKKKDKKMEKEK